MAKSLNSRLYVLFDLMANIGHHSPEQRREVLFCIHRTTWFLVAYYRKSGKKWEVQ